MNPQAILGIAYVGDLAGGAPDQRIILKEERGAVAKPHPEEARSAVAKDGHWQRIASAMVRDARCAGSSP